MAPQPLICCKSAGGWGLLLFPFPSWGSWDCLGRKFVLRDTPWRLPDTVHPMGTSARTPILQTKSQKDIPDSITAVDWSCMQFCGSSEDVPSWEARVGPHCLYTPSTHQGWGQWAWQLATVIAKTVCVPRVLYKNKTTNGVGVVPQSDHHQQLVLGSSKLSLIET